MAEQSRDCELLASLDAELAKATTSADLIVYCGFPKSRAEPIQKTARTKSGARRGGVAGRKSA